MQDIRELSDQELLTALELPKYLLDKKLRHKMEKSLFIRDQTRSPPPPSKRKEPRNAYFLLDIRTPQRWKPGVSILKQSKGNSKTVRFKPTEIFGEEPLLPYCNQKFNCDGFHKQLHNSKCPNALSETVEVLGEHTWMNRQYHLTWRYGI